MARSASQRATRGLGAVALIVAAAGLGGCATTQQEASRLQLNSARIRASEIPTRVAVSGKTVRITRVALVPGRGGTAFVVQVHNAGARPVSDLPISVGVRVGHRPPRYLNVKSPSEFSYFDAHLPAVAAGGTLTWVYATARRLPGRARPFAMVGAVPSVTAKPAGRLPVIRASASSTLGHAGANAAGSQLAVVLQNLSTIPQYQLQVYAYALSGDRYVAAGNLTVPHLGSQARQTSTVALLGRVNHARLQIEAFPTIVQ